MEEIYGRAQGLTIVDKGVSGLLPVFSQGKDAAAAGETK
jgi:hypothetical protein